MDYSVDKAWLSKVMEDITLPADVDTARDQLNALGEAYGQDYYESFDKALEEEAAPTECDCEDPDCKCEDGKCVCPPKTIEEAVKAMEENEDMVECAECYELSEKACCKQRKDGRYVCKTCCDAGLFKEEDELKECGDNCDKTDKAFTEGVESAESVQEDASEIESNSNSAEPEAEPAEDTVKAEEEVDPIATKFAVPELDATVVDSFEEDGKKAYNILYSAEGYGDLVEAEIWDDPAERVWVTRCIYKPNLLDRTYDNFAAFAEDLSYKFGLESADKQVDTLIEDPLDIEFPEPEDIKVED